MIPMVTVLSRPKGLPTAIAHSPTSSLSELPRGTVGQGPFPCRRTTARSVSLSMPTTVPGMRRPSCMPTVTLLVRSTTWALVSTSPSAWYTKPLPCPRSVRGTGRGWAPWDGRPKNWRNSGSLSIELGTPPWLPATATVRSVSMVTTAGPARRTAAATNDWLPRAAAAREEACSGG